jgi:redox-sensitive bicupin YhaK (pirin superfamily)
MNTMTIRQVLDSEPASDGAGVKIRRTVGRARHDLDPFLMLDEIRSESRDDFVAGFPPHPHRGIETLTLLLEGGFEHQDHLGHRAAVRPGGAQWMSTGRGVVHSEMPLPDAGRLHGFQLWVNLPAADKLKEPEYGQAEAEAIPVLDLPGGRLRVVAGEFDGQRSPLDRLACEARVLDLALEPGGRFEWTPPAGHRVLLRPYRGAVEIERGDGEPRLLADGRLAVLEGEGRVAFTAVGDGAGLLVLSGRPLGEPIVQYGPFVMNTFDEIRQAFVDVEEGKFGPVPA